MNDFLAAAVQLTSTQDPEVNFTAAEEQIDLALTRLTKAQIKLGLFDAGKDKQPYFQLGGESIDNAEHQALAHEAAQQ